MSHGFLSIECKGAANSTSISAQFLHRDRPMHLIYSQIHIKLKSTVSETANRPSLAHDDVDGLVNSLPKLIFWRQQCEKLGWPKLQQHPSDLCCQRLITINTIYGITHNDQMSYRSVHQSSENHIITRAVKRL